MKHMQHSCEREIQNVDLKVTPARIATLKLFESNDKPLDAAYLIDQLQKKLSIDRVTVFRIINAFVQTGLVTKFEFREGKTRYELAKRGDHHHFICSSCGNIFDLGEDFVVHEYIKKIEIKYGFTVKEHALEFFGLCKNCQK
jgi:Fur family ferric uptake transcriptional regulator